MSNDSASPSPFEGQRLWMMIGGIVVLALILAGGGYWLLKGSHKKVVAAKRPNLIGVIGETTVALDTAMPEQAKLCSASLARAVDFGVLPQGATLVSSDAKAEQTEGRYTCQAQGIDGKYTLNIDTSCPGTQEKTCFALDSIRREDGAWVYKRKI